MSLSMNPYSWNSKANVIWIDQPSATGYSYDDAASSPVYNENQIADDLYEFMQLFLQNNTKYEKLDFYVTGESYAGHYIPHFSRRVYDGNNNLQPGDVYINLRGLAIGDGLVDPYNQYPGYPPYALDHNLVSKAAYDTMEGCLPLCEEEIKLCNNLNGSEAFAACENAYDTCNICELIPVTSSGINPYDVRIKCEVQPLCYNFTNEDIFFNLKSTMNGLGAKVNKWISCNRVVEMDLVFAGDWMKDFAQDITVLLNDGMNVLVYFGVWDYIVNWYGGYDWMKKLDWQYNKQWNAQKNITWMVDNKVAGYYQTYANLTFLQVLGAGHMVPMNEPENALAMIQQLTVGSGW
eukprot:992039_1